MRHRTQIVYLILILSILASGWEAFSKKYVLKLMAKNSDPKNGAVLFDTNIAGGLKAAIDQFSPSSKPRILVLGSSQIAVIKEGNSRDSSIPIVLQRKLKDSVGDCEVVDLSAGGQVVTESTLVLMGSVAKIQPSAVVMGVSIFGMQGVTIRDSILTAFDIPVLAKEMAEQMPLDVSQSVKDELLSFQKQDSSRGKAKKSETIQQKSDKAIGNWLSIYSSAFSHRQLMFDRLIDEPIRRDLVAYVKRNYQGIKVARTNQIGASYYPSMASIRVAANWCRKRSIAFFVVVLPYDFTISPLPYLPEDQKRLLTDLRNSSKSDGFQVLDLSHALPHEDFGLFIDGSPDGLHFRAAGHEKIGKEIANFMAGSLSACCKTTLTLRNPTLGKTRNAIQ